VQDKGPSRIQGIFKVPVLMCAPGVKSGRIVCLRTIRVPASLLQPSLLRRICFGPQERSFSQVSYLEHLCLQVVCLRHRPEARKRPCAVSGTNARQSAEASLSTGEISIRILTLAFSSLGDRYSACDTGYRRPGDGGHVLYLEQSFWRTPEMPYRQVSPFLLSASVPAFVLNLVNVNDLVKCYICCAWTDFCEPILLNE
jgi:hypothetical protein